MERLHKVLAHAGFGSRRSCEEMILAGEVMVDGKPVEELGVKVDPAKQKIVCQGRPVQAEAPIVIAVNKPRGYVSTTRDEHGRKKVTDLVPFKMRLYPAGRLDADSQGLIILTNDGGLCDRLTHPRYGVNKTYHVVVRGYLKGEVMDRIRKGVWLSEGKTSPAKLRMIQRNRDRTVVEVTLSEGRNREVRRIFARFGLKVRRLKRIRVGGFSLGRLKEGEWRQLVPRDLAKIFGPGPGKGREGCQKRKGGYNPRAKRTRKKGSPKK